MAEADEQSSPIVTRELFPPSDEKVLGLIPEFAWAIARAVAATALADRVLTVGEYEAIADSAASLESLSSYPGLMSYLVLDALQEEPHLNAALKSLQKTTRELPPETRQAIFEATTSIHNPFDGATRSTHERWAKALQVSPIPLEKTGKSTGAEAVQSLVGAGQKAVDSVWKRVSRAGIDPSAQLVERARTMSKAFQDEELSSAISAWGASDEDERDGELADALSSAANRALAKAAAHLKSSRDLEYQKELADRFLHTTEALIEQVRSRLRFVESRLRLQSEMYEEDLEAFIESSVDALEISMRDLTKGRDNWTDPAIWDSFKNRGAFADLKARFSPIQNRYTRLFDQWRHELESFSNEAGIIRSSVFSSVDTRAFSALVPTDHSSACFKCALDRVADTTLKFSAMGALTAGAVTAAGLVKATAIVAALSNPVGATIGGVIGAAALWKAVANKEARKDQVVKGKREQIKNGLRQLFQDQGLSHDEQANEIFTQFVETAIEQYTPIVVEARLWAMKARLEATVTQRVLADTRSFLSPGAN